MNWNEFLSLSINNITRILFLYVLESRTTHINIEKINNKISSISVRDCELRYQSGCYQKLNFWIKENCRYIPIYISKWECYVLPEFSKTKTFCYKGVVNKTYRRNHIINCFSLYVYMSVLFYFKSFVFVNLAFGWFYVET